MNRRIAIFLFPAQGCDNFRAPLRHVRYLRTAEVSCLRNESAKDAVLTCKSKRLRCDADHNVIPFDGNEVWWLVVVGFDEVIHGRWLLVSHCNLRIEGSVILAVVLSASAAARTFFVPSKRRAGAFWLVQRTHPSASFSAGAAIGAARSMARNFSSIHSLSDTYGPGRHRW